MSQEIIRGPTSDIGVNLPISRISLPDYIDHHMISDEELSLLGRSDAGILGSLGFTALGTVFGVLPAFVESYAKFDSGASVSIKITDLTNISIFTGSIVCCVICLLIYGIQSWRNRGLISRIRGRRTSEFEPSRKHL